MTTADRVHDIVAPVFADGSVELVDVEHAGGVLRVTVDQEGGVDMAEISDLTRRISRLLDEADPLPGRYTLEVSSPGLERPLRRPDHFRRAVGDKVAVKTRPEVDGPRRVVGELLAADDHGITIRTEEGGDGGTRHLRHEEIERARTIFDWGPAPKPGRPGSPKPPEKKART